MDVPQFNYSFTQIERGRSGKVQHACMGKQAHASTPQKEKEKEERRPDWTLQK
jgi:hypothetical protein